MALITTQPDYYIYNGGTSANLQSAINAAIAAGKSLFLVPPAPPASAVFQANGLTIANAGRPFKMFAAPGSVTLKMSASSDAVLTISGSNDVEISGINFDGGYVAGAASPISTVWAIVRATTSSRVRFEKCRIANGSTHGLYFDGCGTSQSGSTNPYGAPVTFDNIAGKVQECEVYNIFDGAGIYASSSPGLTIRDNFLHDIKGNGISVSHQFDAPGIGQSHFDGIHIEGNLITDINVVSAITNGQEGNGIVAWLSNNLTICNNTIRYSRWSAIRANECSQVVCNNNNIYACGECAIFIEQPDGATVTGKHPTGYTVVGNQINHAEVGISCANFVFANAGVRLAVIANNVIRHARKRGKTQGVGIIAGGGDTSVTGNVIECCDYYGIILGVNGNTRDLLASNNVIRNCLYGVGASADATSGAMLVTGNLIHIANATTNAVVSSTFDPGNVNPALPEFVVISNLAENQTANAWTKVTNNFRSTLTTPVSPSDGCEPAPVF
jgi:Right handed beta helix region